MNLRSEQGSAMMYVIVALGILGMGAKVLNDMTYVSLKAQKKVEMRGDLEAIRRMLLKTVSCKESYTPTTCPASGVAVKRFLGGSVKEFIPSEGRVFGSWAVKVQCSPSNDGLIARAIRVEEGTDINKISDDSIVVDPLTQTKVDFSDPRSLLFPEGISFCPDRTGFPTPTFDSGWVDNNQTITHNLGTLDYAVFIEWKEVGGNPHNVEFGFDASTGSYGLNSISFNRAKWVDKTENSIRVVVTGQRYSTSGSANWISSPHTAKVRVKLYRYF
ncbi:hypothetical protein [Pseudobacteriovorax antillogorgiicola]|nr:hypothetical protein [Pseudobacteriovorax antillogorgiicola]